MIDLDVSSLFNDNPGSSASNWRNVIMLINAGSLVNLLPGEIMQITATADLRTPYRPKYGFIIDILPSETASIPTATYRCAMETLYSAYTPYTMPVGTNPF